MREKERERESMCVCMYRIDSAIKMIRKKDYMETHNCRERDTWVAHRNRSIHTFITLHMDNDAPPKNAPKILVS